MNILQLSTQTNNNKLEEKKRLNEKPKVKQVQWIVPVSWNRRGHRHVSLLPWLLFVFFSRNNNKPSEAHTCCVDRFALYLWHSMQSTGQSTSASMVFYTRVKQATTTTTRCCIEIQLNNQQQNKIEFAETINQLHASLFAATKQNKNPKGNARWRMKTRALEDIVY